MFISFSSLPLYWPAANWAQVKQEKWRTDQQQNEENFDWSFCLSGFVSFGFLRWKHAADWKQGEACDLYL